MGTNYYLHEAPPCPTCGRQDEPLHIGKSSAGWCFSLHIIPAESIFDLSDWITRWSKRGCVILNEYDDTISTEEMLKVITRRSSPNRDWEAAPLALGYPDWATFHSRNHSQPGPNGLLRHQLGRWCASHGEGTWDCLPGEFS